MRRWAWICRRRALTGLTHGEHHFGPFVHLHYALCQALVGGRKRVDSRLLLLVTRLLIMTIIEFGIVVHSMLQHNCGYVLSLRPAVIDIVGLVNHNIQYGLTSGHQPRERRTYGIVVRTLTSDARRHVSAALVKRILARCSSCSAAGDKHVKGARDTSRHSATYLRN